MKIRVFLVLLFATPFTTFSTTKSIEPIPVENNNYIFDLNKNGFLEPNEYELYLSYKQSHLVTNEVVDTDKDGNFSPNEINRILTFLRSQPKGEQNEMLQQLIQIPGISLEAISSSEKSNK